MPRRVHLHALCALLLAWPATGLAERRHALIIGANTGWAMDRPLRHAHDDARHFAALLSELGEFAPGDVTVLEDPSTERVLQALAQSEAVASAEPGLFLFYYSGHADAEHLHLAGSPLRFDTLYALLKKHPARVKVGVLDACQSGSVLAAKGTRPIPTFSVKLDDALSVQGTAILASSGADELSQEAHALGGSFFTHHLISALRGAADDDRDGRISLSEAYSYAANRTTLDTAVSEAGAQRPVFRYDLKGRGEVYLSHVTTQVGMLDFTTDEGRCFVTDEAERTLVAEVPAGSATRLMVTPGAYVVKCPTPSGYRVAALTTYPNSAILVKGLPFRDQPLSTGVVKGVGAAPNDPTSTVGALEDQLASLKRNAFIALQEGRTDDALVSFNEVLRHNLRDGEAYRGKAQAYLALASAAQTRGDLNEAQRLRTAAVRTDPRLANDRQYLQMVTSTTPVVGGPAPAPPPPPVLAEDAFPRQYQRIGVGLAAFNPHGPLSLSFAYELKEWCQLAAHFGPFVLGFGASARFFPRSGTWSPYVGAGGNFTLAATGAISGPDFHLTSSGTELMRRGSFDRLGYVEGGILISTRHWQFEAGLAVAAGAPLDGPAFVAALPSLSVRYFF